MSGHSIPHFNNPSLVLNARFLPTAGTAKHVVVLLHAFPFSCAMWKRMADHVQTLRQDTALLLVDFPGFGGSTPRVKWDFSSFSLELRDVIERHTRKSVTMAGLSMGGYAALEFYHINSDLVRAIVLSNTRADADSEKEQHDRASFAEDVLARGPEVAIERLYANFVTPETALEIAGDIRKWMLEANPTAMASALNAMANRHDSRDMLPLVTVPSLVIASDRDRVMRTTVMRKMASELEDPTFVEIKGAAHLSAVEKSLEWATVLSNFLDRV